MRHRQVDNFALGFVVGSNYVVGMIILSLSPWCSSWSSPAEPAGWRRWRQVLGCHARKTDECGCGSQCRDHHGAEAKIRREELQQEADFFGAMDGASKFVKGDAIAGIIITLINIFGGFVIGIWQLDMSLSDALQTYTILSVGDGLVAQIPALLVSTGTGILVTRAGTGESLGKDVVSQLTGFPKVVALASASLLVGLVPGIQCLFGYCQ